MDLTDLNGYHLRKLAAKNVLLGKNGCGKSRLLKAVDAAVRGRPDVGAVRYLSPERGGLLQYEANIEQNLTSNAGWLPESRRHNQAGQFRQQSTAQFRGLELLILREIEQTPAIRSDPSVTFDRTVERINKLLDRVYIKRADSTFRIHDRITDAQVAPSEVSSGESELISLGIECLVFEKESRAGKLNLLLIDEPDVHLHPDLQARLARFVHEIVKPGVVSVLIATHSTALLGAMSEEDDTHLAFMRFGDVDIAFSPATHAQRRVLPVFGAHPLSNVFNQAPVLLVEGEDDERIWQRAVRSSQGRIKVYPCAVDGVAEMASFEQEAARILHSVYDDATGFSLRDRDSNQSLINDVGPIRRMRLNCRSAENLLLADEVIEAVGLSWERLRGLIENWLEASPAHPHLDAMREFADSNFDRLNADLKQVRNDLVGLMGTHKPWEVLVGQAIASMQTLPRDPGPTSLCQFLGPAVCQHLIGLSPQPDIPPTEVRGEASA